MLAETVAAAVVGALALWLVLQPLMRPVRRSSPSIEPIDPEETPKGVALAALKEIEFDRETGKLSEEDYELLKARYTAAALAALRGNPSVLTAGPASDDVESMIAARLRALRSASGTTSSDPPVHSNSIQPLCPSCGPRSEADAAFCSTCGRRLSNELKCNCCGASLNPGSKFCESCGQGVAA
jgi:hypothetical protein